MRYATFVQVGLLGAVLFVGACGGGGGQPAVDPGPSPGPAPHPIRNFALTMSQSSAERFRARAEFGMPTFGTRLEAGVAFTTVALEGCRPGGAKDGAPGVPILTRLLAVPQGARALVADVEVVVAETRTLLLDPYQAQEGDFHPAFEEPRDEYPRAEESWVPPFSYDVAAYAGTALTPRDVVEVSTESTGRDLAVVVLRIAAGQYAPATRALTLFASVEFTVEFVGSTGGFLAPGAGNPFEERSRTTIGALWNAEAVGTVTEFAPFQFVVHGEEFLILTHPDYRDAADRLAAHKNARGLLTTVVDVNDGAGGGPDTKEEIRTFLAARYAAALVRFSYLLLLGDAEDIAPFVLPRRYKEGEFASDFPYAQIGTDPLNDDLLPEIAVGRISVQSLAQADVVVDKIIAYEASPPLVLAGGTFYGHVAIASYFQPGEGGSPANVENLRRFVQDSEDIRGRMVAEGFDVERIYTAHHPLTEANYPRYYKDGVTLLPAPLRPEDAYPWDGDTQAVIDAFNAGKSLYFHLDHGWWGGWGDPSFGPADLPALTNGELLPLVLSANCSSGAFDYPNQGFAEEIVRRSGGGAIGALAFTRNSNNGVGRLFVIGVVDALWPSSYPNIGDATEHHRLGDMLNYARSVMTLNHVGASPATDDGYLGAWCYARMLTLFGDPTLAVWLENPFQLPLDGDQFVAGPAIDLVYPYAGATVTVFEQLADGLLPIGRATAGPGGVVHIDPLVAPTDVANLRFFAAAPGALPTEITVPTGP